MEDTDRLIIEQIPSLRRYAMALTGDRTLADDLVQDCLERALGRINLWRKDSNIRAWLFTVLKNIHRNNRTRRWRRGHETELDDEIADDGAGRQDMRLEAKSLENALMALPEEQREAVLLVGLENMSYAEAANVLGIPKGTLMSRLHRGRERLRLLMDGETVPTLRRVK